MFKRFLFATQYIIEQIFSTGTYFWILFLYLLDGVWALSLGAVGVALHILFWMMKSTTSWYQTKRQADSPFVLIVGGVVAAAVIFSPDHPLKSLLGNLALLVWCIVDAIRGYHYNFINPPPEDKEVVTQEDMGSEESAEQKPAIQAFTGQETTDEEPTNKDS